MSQQRTRRAKHMLSLGPPEGEGWFWQSTAMNGSITYQALGIHSRRILDFLIQENAGHRGRENGNLAATFNQLVQWGLTRGDIRKGFAELIAGGFVRRVHCGMRIAGGGDPSRYALTWLPTLAGSDYQAAATNDWKGVIASLDRTRVGNVKSARRWLKSEISPAISTGRRKQKPSAHLRLVSVLTCDLGEAS